MTRFGATIAPRRPAWFWLLAITLIISLYLPMLRARFDFVDDGNLVYPAPAMGFSDRLRLTGQKIAANYDHLGPFRPVLWAHWDLQAEWLGADALRWRLWRLAWTALATAAWLWWLRELGMTAWAAVMTAALAMWSPAPGEIWRSLTLSEGVAMPYALGALACALRAGRSARPWAWDLAGAAAALAALGCKNTFAAIVPAQLLLRVAPDGETLGPALRRRGARAALLALPLLLPVGHYVVFLRHWHPGQYETGAPTWAQLERMLNAVLTGANLAAMGPGLFITLVVLVAGQAAVDRHVSRPGVARAVASAVTDVWRRHRAACRAAVALLSVGVAIYLPMRGAAGRYAIPAVWGVYLIVAALLTELVRWRNRRWAGVALALVVCGLAATAVENLLRQDKAIARAALLWQVLEGVEQRARPGTVLEWQLAPDLGVGEGIHFAWHLRGRGRGDLGVRLLDERRAPVLRPEIAGATGSATLLLTTPAGRPSDPAWAMRETFVQPYRWGRRRFECELWTRPVS